MIHLDTSFLGRALVRGPPEDEKVRQWLTEGTALGMSTIAWGEFLCGPKTARHMELWGLVLER